MGDVFYFKDTNGRKRDNEIHEEILTKLESNWEGSSQQEAAIKNAVEKFGLTLEVATKVYSSNNKD